MSQDMGKNFPNERGVTATEYALIVAVVAIIMLIGAQMLGTNLSSVFSSIAGGL